MGLFADRHDGGRALAGELSAYAGRADVIVLGLPRGGVPVAREVADALRVPLDVFVVRKLGVPGHPELAFGAIATGDIRVLNDDVVHGHRLLAHDIDVVMRHEGEELRRREATYRVNRRFPSLTGLTVLLVDDGLATGASMRAAAVAVRRLGATTVVCAVPVAPAGAKAELSDVADDVVCAHTPSDFRSVGQHYDDFAETTDAEVTAALARV
ncbi:MAG: putative phosphoribosyl transferase [Frankiaceae bacterium]|jgi:predicted phosphoribosyltransferase|nr:putative phosphoribosyl transferase [Frankiaceae bacterium]